MATRAVPDGPRSGARPPQGPLRAVARRARIVVYVKVGKPFAVLLVLPARASASEGPAFNLLEKYVRFPVAIVSDVLR